ncbi:MAG TPA: bifunctional lysylphosphatidylglycerol synthetase/lysine--tRNA ligase LysX [Mycobacteriales bacterium]|nr:bifunctional lysylphosphatidylglycerol synthetase/lysine--tRNA ligase LysX [Mycobacteriales bacterium]
MTDADDLPEQMRVRREKLERLAESGVDCYPVGFPRTATLGELRERYDGLPADTSTGDTVAVAGRVVSRRGHGKLAFAVLRDGSADLQVMLSLDRLGDDRLEAWQRDVDLADHVGIEGEVITSRRGELSILADRWQITTKALRPLPSEWYGMDAESRVRQRYVDLIVNPDARRVLAVRSAVVRSLRDSLTARGYLEVETPMLQVMHGGAAARPFRTHMNALDIELFLRIAPELYLKRLLVGGVERIFEINRNFRNEGADSSHNPEFTMIEAYQAYGDYDSMAELTRELVQEACRAATRSTEATLPDGTSVDLGGDWASVTLHGAVSSALGEEVTVDTSRELLERHAERAGVEVDPAWSAGALVLELFEKLVEHTLREPTFVRDYPIEVRPLTRQHRDEPRLTESWDLIVNGRELGTAYSELTDPIEQRRRLVEQAALAAGGDAEAMSLDEDFLRALEHGMPPAGGMGMGVDRLVMLVAGVAGIRDVILFPLVRPE